MMDIDLLSLNIDNIIGIPKTTDDNQYFQIGNYSFHKKKTLIVIAVFVLFVIALFIYFFISKSKEEPKKIDEPTKIVESELKIIQLGQIEVPVTFNKCKDKSFISQFNADVNINDNGILESIGARCTDGTFIEKVGNTKEVASYETNMNDTIGFNSIRVYYNLLDGTVTGFELYNTSNSSNSNTPIASIGKIDNQSYTGMFQCDENMAFSGIRLATNKANGRIAAINLLCKKI